MRVAREQAPSPPQVFTLVKPPTDGYNLTSSQSDTPRTLAL
ncbi:hypothetical protein C4J90_3846 [Pseudomonas sp. R2-60-08W]|nr:hypothetical protein C4J91_4018 [Pseudomonas sp. R3-52-08]AZF28002.1 hypothetical protein C4J90_3846 [Pseudomonas sp. R2-60-08W]